MKYEILKGFKDEEFRRLTGVKQATFDLKAVPVNLLI